MCYDWCPGRGAHLSCLFRDVSGLDVRDVSGGSTCPARLFAGTGRVPGRCVRRCRAECTQSSKQTGRYAGRRRLNASNWQIGERSRDLSMLLRVTARGGEDRRVRTRRDSIEHAVVGRGGCTAPPGRRRVIGCEAAAGAACSRPNARQPCKVGPFGDGAATGPLIAPDTSDT